MNYLFALGIFSAAINLAFCQVCNHDLVNHCEKTYRQELSLESSDDISKCYYTQKMLGCIVEGFCLKDEMTRPKITKLKQYMNRVCEDTDISLGPQTNEGEYQARRSLFSMWIGIMIALAM